MDPRARSFVLEAYRRGDATADGKRADDGATLEYREGTGDTATATTDRGGTPA